jgi:hypothetical protein
MVIKRIKLSEYFSLQKNKMITFKITPNISVSNNQNHKMWRMLHKLYEVYEATPSRITRNGFHFTYREKDNIWFDTVFRQKDGKKSVEFFISTTEIWAKKLRETIESYMKVTIEEVEACSFSVPEGDIKLREISLARHDIFSLQTDAREQTAPITSIMSTLNDLTTDEDYARLSVCTEAFGRGRWLKTATWAHEKLTKGKVPQRAKITPGKVITVLKVGLITMLNEMYDVINDTLKAISNVFFKSENKYEKKSAIGKKQALSSEINSTQLSSKSSSKINQPVWKTHIRVAAKTSEPLRSQLIINTLGSAFSEIAGDNELLPVKINFKKRREEVINELNTLRLSNRTKVDGDVSLLSCDELSKVSLQLPTAAVQQKYEDALSVNKKVETDIPSIFIHKKQKEGGMIGDIKVSIGSNNITSNQKVRKPKAKSNSMLIGHSESKGEQLPIGIPLSNPNEFFKGYVFQGQMGAGKDTAIQNFVTEGCLKHNISFVVIDQVNKEGKEGMANGIRDSLPPEKLVDLDLSNEKHLPPLDLTEVMSKLGRKGADRFANELIQFLEVDDMGQSRKLLRNFAKACNGSLYQLQQLLEDESFRVKRIKKLRKEGNTRLADELDKYTTIIEQEAKTNTKGEVTSVKDKVIRDGQKTLDGKAAAILNRLDSFLGDDTLFSIFAQPPKSEMSFEAWMREGKTIIIRVPDRILSQIAVKTLVHWITLKVLMTRLLMDNEGQENGAFIVFNEPQTYLKENAGLADLMARIAVQGRKERLGSIFACHHIGQIKEISEDLISGGVHWFLFKNDNKKTFEALETELKPNFDVESAMRTEKYHAINILNFGGDRKPAFLVKMLPPSYERYQAFDNSFLTRRHASLYGRPVEEIENLISQEDMSV